MAPSSRNDAGRAGKADGTINTPPPKAVCSGNTLLRSSSSAVGAHSATPHTRRARCSCWMRHRHSPNSDGPLSLLLALATGRNPASESSSASLSLPKTDRNRSRSCSTSSLFLARPRGRFRHPWPAAVRYTLGCNVDPVHAIGSGQRPRGPCRTERKCRCLPEVSEEVERKLTRHNNLPARRNHAARSRSRVRSRPPLACGAACARPAPRPGLRWALGASTC